jgi:hypothetical protein
MACKLAALEFQVPQASSWKYKLDEESSGGASSLIFSRLKRGTV